MLKLLFRKLGVLLVSKRLDQKGGGSFAHVIKASEPVVAVLLNLVIKGNAPKPLTALSLIPIVYGVAYAATLGDFNPVKMKTELTSVIAM